MSEPSDKRVDPDLGEETKDEPGLQRKARGVRGGAGGIGEAEGSEAPRASDGPPDPKEPFGPLVDMSDAYVRFESSGELYALDLATVREVVSAAPFSRIPRAPAAAVGLMNHGGRVYTIVDLAALERKEEGRARDQVVLLDEPTRLLGITVDRVEGIGPLQIDGDLARFRDRAVAVVRLDALIRDIDSAFESSSMLVFSKPARSLKEF